MSVASTPYSMPASCGFATSTQGSISCRATNSSKSAGRSYWDSPASFQLALAFLPCTRPWCPMEAPTGLDDGPSATAGALAAAPRDMSSLDSLSTASRTTLASTLLLALAFLSALSSSLAEPQPSFIASSAITTSTQPSSESPSIASDVEELLRVNFDAQSSQVKYYERRTARPTHPRRPFRSPVEPRPRGHDATQAAACWDSFSLRPHIGITFGYRTSSSSSFLQLGAWRFMAVAFYFMLI